MLKDKLMQLSEKKLCSVGTAMGKMDDETKAAFADCMRSSVGHKTIADALRSEGINITRESISSHRQCFFKETENLCHCKMAEKSSKK
jgi:hypothetical protein